MHDKMKQQLRLVNIGGIAAVVLIIVGSVMLGVIPLFKRGTQNIADTVRLRSDLAALDGLSQTLNQVEEERKQTENRLKAIEKRLPNSSETNSFIRELAKVTDAAGIRVEGTNYPKELKDAGGYKSLPVQVTGIGSWESCYKFLTGLRSMDRLTRLDSLTLDTQRDPKSASAEPICRITVNFSTFFMAR